MWIILALSPFFSESSYSKNEISTYHHLPSFTCLLSISETLLELVTHTCMGVNFIS